MVKFNIRRKGLLTKRWLLFAVALFAIAIVGTGVYNLKVKRDREVLSCIEKGHSHLSKGEIDSAYEQYLKAWTLKPSVTSPDERNAAVNLAQIKIMKGDRAGARDLLLAAIKYDPYFYASYLFLGDIYLKEKDADSALFYLEKGLSLKAYFMKDDPNAALLYYNMAEALLQKGDKEGAKRYLDTFISVAGGDKRLTAIVEKAREKLARI